MRILFNIISIIIMLSVIFLASLNTQMTLNFVMWSPTAKNAVIHDLSLTGLMLTILIAGILAGIFWASSFYLSNRSKLKEYQRKLEKSAVQSDEDSSKVAVLEEKIKVLEKALESALEKNND